MMREMTQVPGRFITLEGCEGAGKSTNMRIIRRWLEKRGRQVTQCREPGGTRVSEALREILLDARNDGLGSKAEALLMFAARAQLLEEVIEPALALGHDVLCDRFTDATYAYQGGGRELGFEAVAALERVVHPDLQPDLTLLFDVPVEIGLARASRRSDPDRFEREHVAFFERVRKAYLRRAEQAPGRFAIIDAGRSLAEVRQDVLDVLDARLQ